MMTSELSVEHRVAPLPGPGYLLIWCNNLISIVALAFPLPPSQAGTVRTILQGEQLRHRRMKLLARRYKANGVVFCRLHWPFEHNLLSSLQSPILCYIILLLYYFIFWVRSIRPRLWQSTASLFNIKINLAFTLLRICVRGYFLLFVLWWSWWCICMCVVFLATLGKGLNQGHHTWEL